MTLPVYEYFSTEGYNTFNEPDSTFEQIRLTGIFDRAQIQTENKRSALLEVAVSTGLAGVVCEYVNARDNVNGVVQYALRDPIAIYSWAREFGERIRQSTSSILEDIFVGRWSLVGNQQEELFVDEIQQLQGIRAIIMALIKRFHDASTALETSDETQSLQRSELQGLFSNLLATQSMLFQLQVGTWFVKRNLSYDADAIQLLHRNRADALKEKGKSFRRQWEIEAMDGLSFDLIIMKVVHAADLGSTMDKLPPTDPNCIYRMLDANIPLILESFLSNDGMDRLLSNGMDDAEDMFHSQLAILLYLCLDASFLAIPRHTGQLSLLPQEWVAATKVTASSVAKLLGLPDKMHNALLAFWFIDCGCNSFGEMDVEDGAIYTQAAVQEAVEILSDVNINQQLDFDIKVAVIQSLLVSGEHRQASRLLSVFHMPMNEYSTKSYVIMAMTIYLEKGVWEEALSFQRDVAQNPAFSGISKDLLNMLYLWFEKTSQLNLLLNQSLLPEEETQLEEFLVIPREVDLACSGSIKCVDILIAYLLFGHKIDQAIDIDQQHRQALRQSGSADVPEQHSFQVRQALLEMYQKNMVRSSCKPSLARERTCNIFLNALKLAEEIEEQKNSSENTTMAAIVDETNSSMEMDIVDPVVEEVGSDEDATPAQPPAARRIIALRSPQVNNLQRPRSPAGLSNEVKETPLTYTPGCISGRVAALGSPRLNDPQLPGSPVRSYSKPAGSPAVYTPGSISGRAATLRSQEKSNLQRPESPGSPDVVARTPVTYTPGSLSGRRSAARASASKAPGSVASTPGKQRSILVPQATVGESWTQSEGFAFKKASPATSAKKTSTPVSIRSTQLDMDRVGSSLSPPSTTKNTTSSVKRLQLDFESTTPASPSVQQTLTFASSDMEIEAAQDDTTFPPADEPSIPEASESEGSPSLRQKTRRARLRTPVFRKNYKPPLAPASTTKADTNDSLSLLAQPSDIPAKNSEMTQLDAEAEGETEPLAQTANSPKKSTTKSRERSSKKAPMDFMSKALRTPPKKSKPEVLDTEFQTPARSTTTKSSESTIRRNPRRSCRKATRY